MIEFRNVTKNYGSNVGLKNATVRIEKGDFVFLVGPSGAGSLIAPKRVAGFKKLNFKALLASIAQI